MMFWKVVSALIVAMLGMVSAQADATQPSVCAAGCVNGVFANAAGIGCPNGDSLCVCANTVSFDDGIRDCVSEACGNEPAAVQIPLAQTYGHNLCAAMSSSMSATATSTAAPAEPTGTDAAVAATSTTAAMTTAASTTSAAASGGYSVPSSEGTTTATSSSASLSTATTKATSVPLSATSVLASTQSSPTTSKTSGPAATVSPSASGGGLSAAAKAGIGAGIGAAALAAAIIAALVFWQQRQKKKSLNRVRAYKISEPMAGSGRQFAPGTGGAEITIPKPVHLEPPAQPVSPTSVYSYASDLEANARRYEDMQPRTQPRTMI